MCSKSCVVFLAFRRSAGRLRRVLLEDHLVAPTPRQGRAHPASSLTAGRRRSIDVYGHLKATEQGAEERRQDDDRHYF